MDEIEICYSNCLKYVAARSVLLKCLQQTSLGCLSERDIMSRSEAVTGEAEELYHTLCLAELFILVNYTGLHDLLAKLDQISAVKVWRPCVQALHDLGRYRDLGDTSQIDLLLTELELRFGARQRPRMPLWAWQDPRAQRVDTAAAWDGWRAPAPCAPPLPAVDGAGACVFVCRSNRARSLAVECVARARLGTPFFGASGDGPPVLFFSAGSTADSGGAIKAGVRAALERAGYCTAGLAPKSLGALLEEGLEGRPVHCIVSLACGGGAELRGDGALGAALAARQSTPALLADAAIPAPTPRPCEGSGGGGKSYAAVTAAAALYDGLVRDAEALVARLPALLRDARPLAQSPRSGAGPPPATF
jgi:hypothetical protein